MWRYAIPLVIFIVIAIFLGRGLTLDPHDVPSPLIGKPAADFSLSELEHPEQKFAKKDLLGKVSLVNFWSSWCGTCRQEHPILLELARSGLVDIYGINYKDTRADANSILAEGGNPYKAIGFDEDGRVGIDFGVYGVPETYVIDQQGIIRYKLAGTLTPQILQKDILPLIKELQG